MHDHMADPALTGMVVVSLAEELPAVETHEMLEWLDAEQLVEVVGSHGQPDPRTARSERSRPTPASRSARRPLSTTGSIHEQQRWLEFLPDGPQLPFLFGVTGPAEVARRLADVLEER